MARISQSRILPVVLAVSAAVMAPRPAAADGPVGILVLHEHGVGSAAQAQPYVDKFVALAGKRNGWSGATGQYTSTRAAAETFIGAQKPHYGILSLGAFLGLKAKYNLEVIGQVSATHVGGQQYHLISKTQGDLAGCKGKRLATDHADDAKFIEQVVAGGKFKLGDFTLVTTTRPLQTIKKVTSGDAECALIDDAQAAELAHLDGADGVKVVWSGDKLPPMAVVAFPSAPAAERAALQGSLGKMCQDEGAAVCGELGIQSFKSAGAAEYGAVTAAYGK